MSYSPQISAKGTIQPSHKQAYVMEAARLESDIKTLEWFSRLRRLNETEALRLAQLRQRAEDLKVTARRLGWNK